jgi:hypothetical protein
MNNDVLHRTWDVDPAGYCWEKSKFGSVNIQDRRHYGRRLQTVEKSLLQTRRYQPTRRHGGLFRTFADIKPGPDAQGLVNFANQFGLLGTPPSGFRLNYPTMNVPKLPTTWDLLGIWLLAIGEMRDLVMLREMIREGNRERLGQHIQWEGSTEIYYCTWPDPILGGGERELIFSVDRHGHTLEQFTPGDVILPAMHYLRRRVNYWSHAAASPKLVWDAFKSRMELKLIPSSLLGAMWLQFALAIAGDKDFRQCKECGQWFELSPITARANRLFCSGPCKSKDYRAKRKRALALKRKGLSVKEIATELGSDVSTIRG